MQFCVYISLQAIVRTLSMQIHVLWIYVTRSGQIQRGLVCVVSQIGFLNKTRFSGNSWVIPQKTVGSLLFSMGVCSLLFLCKIVFEVKVLTSTILNIHYRHFGHWERIYFINPDSVNGSKQHQQFSLKSQQFEKDSIQHSGFLKLLFTLVVQRVSLAGISWTTISVLL